MLQTMFAVVALGVLAPAPAAPTPPYGMAPTGSVVKVVDNTLEMTESSVVYREEIRTETRLVNGQVVTVQVKVAVPTTRLIQKRVELASVQGFGVDGRPIDPKRLRELLVNDTAVLVSADGRPVDPFYLRLLKEGTLILVLAGTEKGPPPPIPQPLPR